VELEKLLNSEQRQVAVSVLAAELGVPPHQVADFLVTRVAPAYVKYKIYTGDKEDLARKVFKPDEEIVRLWELVYVIDSKCQSIKNLVLNVCHKIDKSKTAEFRGLLYRRLYEYSESYLSKRRERKQILTGRYDEIVDLVAPAHRLLDVVTRKENDKGAWVHDICDDFKTEYEKTSRNKTLAKSDDQKMAALVKKWLEFGRTKAMTLL